MAMIPFHSQCHDLAIRETRSATVRGDAQIPDGEYGFIEHYCDDISCDCRCVLVSVVSATTKDKVWATINYGWEDVSHYEVWMRNKELAEEIVGAALDPLNSQTEHALALLELFRLIIEDRGYVERLRRHYQLFKATLRESKAHFRSNTRRRRR